MEFGIYFLGAIDSQSKGGNCIGSSKYLYIEFHYCKNILL
jgi:hypothetical protein